MAGSGAIGRAVEGRSAAWLAVALWLSAYVIFIASGYASEYARPKPMMNHAFHLLYEAACAVAGLLMSVPIYLALRDADRLSPTARAAVAAAVVIAATCVHSVIDVVAEALLVEVYLPDARLAPFVVSASFNFLVLVWLHGLYAAGVTMLQYAAALRQRELQLAETRALAHQAQLAALRFQLNPHFLFNTLNALSTLVVTARNAEAETMIGRLCEFLRAALTCDPQSPTPLAEELGMAEAYLEIETVRFGDRMQVEMVWPAELADALVPGLVLQPLVENAVKYGVAPARRPVRVRVAASAAGADLVLTVEDDGEADELPSGHHGTGVGLENTRRRLAALYGERSVVEAGRRDGGGWRTTLRLPLSTPEPARNAA